MTARRVRKPIRQGDRLLVGHLLTPLGVLQERALDHLGIGDLAPPPPPLRIDPCPNMPPLRNGRKGLRRLSQGAPAELM